MRLSTQDRIEFMKAAVKAKDVESLRQWVVSVVDAIDGLPDGKADAACPSYRVPVQMPLAPATAPNGQAPLMPLAG